MPLIEVVVLKDKNAQAGIHNKRPIQRMNEIIRAVNKVDVRPKPDFQSDKESKGQSKKIHEC